ncbi:DUF2726 domain-containing protein [Campylobacter sp. US33a]|uniref:DUF2726 domain-containing protein n=1 Tax=Campylobacter sp. US33a TaxID=2498120 RepID=UPI0010684403|nr:DUF2726 domain-containing protein [Campylobacter sp. US33a]TEY03135.1 DUF2726 domain-containing protein [Campylobacter sp. US33a]
MIFFIIILFIIIFILLFINYNKEKTNQNLNKIILEQSQKEQERKLKNHFFLEQKRQEDEEIEYKKSQECKLELIKNHNILASDKLMGLQEFMIYKELIFCEDIKNNFIVFPQISLKSFLKNEEESEVWKAYSNLIIDFLFVIKDFKNKTTKPFAVLEFNGGGHYGDKSDLDNVEKIKKNDEIKKQAIIKAGLLFFILEANDVCKENQYFIDEEKLKIKIHIFAKILKSNLEAFSS